MITYKYSLWEDIKMIVKTVIRYRWLKRNRLIFFLPSIGKLLQLRKQQPHGPNLDIHENIICYWVSSGTWGSYEGKNTIYICPWEISSLEDVVRHEITHLMYEDKVIGLTHDEKEDFIERKVQERREW